MKKSLFQYCQKHLRLIDSGEFKVTPSFKGLANDYNIGYIENGLYYFRAQDKLHLIKVIAQEHNGLRLSDAYPEKQSRLQVAAHSRNEKGGALKVSEHFILLNSLHSLCINQHVSENSLACSQGRFMYAPDINSIEHKQIILVENLAIMANLSLLNLPEGLENALWLYRGDAGKNKQAGTAYDFFRRFLGSHQLICFSDFDPKGLEIAITSGASHWLALKHAEEINMSLNGHEIEWFKQGDAKKFLLNNAKLTEEVAALLTTMNHSQKTLQQEHIAQHGLPLTLYALRED